MSEKLFYKDPYKREFDAVVERIVPRNEKGLYAVILDRTVFYPEGGGQPADTGVVGGVPIIDVRKEDDEVLHLCGDLPAFGEGSPVHCSIDWQRRYDFMQQHSGQHLISAAFFQMEEIDTVSVHLGDQYSTVELDVETVVDDTLRSVERLVNQVIGRNIPVQTQVVATEELDVGSLRRQPKVSGLVRIVSIEEIDRVACGGVHVATTGEIGLIKLIGTETVRGHVRTIWKIGDRAYEDYSAKTELCSRLVDILSAPLEDLYVAAEKLIYRLESTQKRADASDAKRAAFVAGKLASESSSAITYCFEDEENSFVRGVASALLDTTEMPFCLVNIAEGKLRWCIGGSALTHENGKGLLGILLPIIEGKGGGKPPLWQGVGDRLDAAADFITSFGEQVEGMGGGREG